MLRFDSLDHSSDLSNTMADDDAELSERQEMEVEALAAIYESGEAGKSRQNLMRRCFNTICFTFQTLKICERKMCGKFAVHQNSSLRSVPVMTPIAV